jgi:hypothetical protein
MILTLLISALLGQAQATKPASPPPALKLTGCVSPKPGATGDYTFTDDAGAKYRLTGKDSKKYGGKKVEVTEASTKGLTVRGGLYPTPNVAGQAGAIDPAQAAIAAQPGGGARGVDGSDLPEFRASRVRVVEGACQ